MGDTKFETWLSERFRALNTDEAVFVPYIKSIVEGDESSEEKIDALDGILGELAEADGNLDVEAFRTDIISRWEQQQKESCGGSGDGRSASNELDVKFERLLQLNDNLTSSTSNQEDGKGSKHFAVPDSTLRAAILNKCQDSSENESDGEGASGSGTGTRGGGGGGGVKSLGLERNTNAERVQDELKDKRERDKAEAAKKREKDKEDRAKQKQQQQDRKDKAKKKAAKVERKAR